MSEWEYSLEGIHYRINNGGGDYLGGLNTQIAVEALSKLSHNVSDWALENLFFFSSKGSQYIPLNEMKGWKGIIILKATLYEEPKEEQVFTVAHEIAHAKLNHHFLSTPKENQEGEADRLAKKWLDRG